MQIKKLILSSLLSVNILMAQNSIGLNINNKDIEAIVSLDLNSLNNYSNGTTYTIDSSYLHTDTNNMGTIGISAMNSLPLADRISLSFGLKSIFASDFLALPLYAKASFEVPFNDTVPETTISTSITYSPSVLTFKDGDNFRDFRVEANMEVIPSIHIFTGYRNIYTNYKEYDKLFNNKFYGGMKVSF